MSIFFFRGDVMISFPNDFYDAIILRDYDVRYPNPFLPPQTLPTSWDPHPILCPRKTLPSFPKKRFPVNPTQRNFPRHLSQPGDRSTCRLEAPKIECQSLDHHLGLLGNSLGSRPPDPPQWLRKKLPRNK